MGEGERPLGAHREDLERVTSEDRIGKPDHPSGGDELGDRGSGFGRVEPAPLAGSIRPRSGGTPGPERSRMMEAAIGTPLPTRTGSAVGAGRAR